MLKLLRIITQINTLYRYLELVNSKVLLIIKSIYKYRIKIQCTITGIQSITKNNIWCRVRVSQVTK